MGAKPRPVAVSGSRPESQQLRTDVLKGLTATRKSLPCKYFYDAIGSRLFEEICDLPEYYLTRTEVAIMRDHAEEMAARLRPRGLLIEYGSGGSHKTRILLDRAAGLAGYVPVDISCEHLRSAAAGIAADYPGLEVFPVCADYTASFEIPRTGTAPSHRIVYFPGSTVGNFDPEEARAFFVRIRGTVGRGGGLLIGVDLKKDRATLEAAYDDAKGVTAAFNLNILARLNRELGADFDTERFAHRAFYDEEHGRIEMHLKSRVAQIVHLGETTVAFEEGESILTEYSYKYSLAEFARLAAAAGLVVERVWRDGGQRFSVQYLRVP